MMRRYLGVRYKLLASSVANSCKCYSYVTRTLVQRIKHLKVGVSATVNDQSYVCQHTHEYPATHFASAIVYRGGTLGGGRGMC